MEDSQLEAASLVNLPYDYKSEDNASDDEVDASLSQLEPPSDDFKYIGSYMMSTLQF